MCKYSVKTNNESKYSNHKRHTQGNAIYKTKGKFCSIVYVTKDGRETKMWGRIGVRKYLKQPATVRNMDREVVTFYDLKRKGYRSLLESGIKTVKTQGLEINYA